MSAAADTNRIRAVQNRAYREALAAGASMLATERGWARWLRLAGRLPGYTTTNLLTVLGVPAATDVADEAGWQARGRQVFPHAGGIPLVGGAFPRDRVSHVFDITETAEIPNLVVPPPVSGPPAGNVADAVQALLLRRQFSVGWHDQRGQLAIDGQARRVWLPRRDNAEAHLRDLGHVIAHLRRHSAAVHAHENCTGLARLEAESVGWLLATRAGVAVGNPPAPAARLWDRAVNPAALARDIATAVLGTVDVVMLELAQPTPVASSTQTRARMGATRARRVATQTAAAAARAATPRPQPASPAAPVASRAAPADPQARLRAVVAEAADWYTRQLREDRDRHEAGLWRQAPAWDYLSSRGLDNVVRQDDRWIVGYAPDTWTALVDHLQQTAFDQKTFTVDEIVAAGLGTVSSRGNLIDVFRNRIVFGIRDTSGAVVGFTGRTLGEVSDTTPKYKNSPTTSVFDKGQLLFGLSENQPMLGAGVRPVVVEGPMDVLAAAAVSLEDGKVPIPAVAACGTAFTAEQAAALTHASTARTGIIVALDPDPAGKAAAARLYDLLYTEEAMLLRANLVDLDPAEVYQTGGAQELRHVLTNPDQLDALATAAIDEVVDRRVELDRLQFQSDGESPLPGESRFAAALAAAPIIAGEPRHAHQLIGYLAWRLEMAPSPSGYTFATEQEIVRINKALRTIQDLVMAAVHTNTGGVMDRLSERDQPRQPTAGPAVKPTAVAFPVPVGTQPRTGRGSPTSSAALPSSSESRRSTSL